MGVILDKYVNKNVRMGIWEVVEDYQFLLKYVDPCQEDLKILKEFRNHGRKLEWLSVRALLKTMLKNKNRVIYDQNRKPFLENNSYNISISHSKNYSSILLGTTHKVGIDLEYMNHDIFKIADKFINENEVINNDPFEGKIQLYIHWCAKEALYKICDKQDINFKKNLIISPFKVTESGFLTGTVQNMYGKEVFSLEYMLKDNYTIVWCSK
ncbi:MAG: 4'-phosphopantetheinyl transferase family protein [Bacteroidota bacterium]